MPITQFRQSRGFITIESEINDDGIVYRKRDILRSFEFNIPFEQIPDKVVRIFNTPRLYILISLIFFFFGAVFAFRMYNFLVHDTVTPGKLLLSLFLAVIAIFGTWMRSGKYVGYITQDVDILFFDKKGKNSPSVYLRNIQECRALYSRQIMFPQINTRQIN